MRRTLSEIKEELRYIISSLSQTEHHELEGDISFSEFGIDSMMISTLIARLDQDYGVEIPIRELMIELDTLDKLSQYISDRIVTPVSVETTHTVEITDELGNSDSTVGLINANSQAYANNILEFLAQQKSTMESIISKQLEVVNRLMLSGETNQNVRINAIKDKEVSGATSTLANVKQNERETRSLSHFVPFVSEIPEILTQNQKKYLVKLQEKIIDSTKKSKEIAQEYRGGLADPDEVAGFSLDCKEVTYQLTLEKGIGSHAIDVDGNSYIDLAMGYGSLLFGHSPDFQTNALKDEVDLGIQLGYRHRLVGNVAKNISNLTGMDRVAFCTTGTEAVMSAIKMARASSGKNKIAIFTGCYHGHSDLTLVTKFEEQAIVVASGVSKTVSQDVIVLNYNDAESFDIIRKEKNSLAAVLIEPIQSRRPDVQPESFLKELREVTAHSNVFLIFDEVITGFRCHVGGAAALFNIKPDMVIYGKTVANGLPIGVIAGKADVMDAADGGAWNYNDSTYPRAKQTYFAGTFFKHPLSLASANAVLEQFMQNANDIQETLTIKTEKLVSEINQIFNKYKAPLYVKNFSSLFKFFCTDSNSLLEIFYLALRHKGVYIWSGRTCFLSTAHTEQDLINIIHTIDVVIRDMHDNQLYSLKDSITVN